MARYIYWSIYYGMTVTTNLGGHDDGADGGASEWHLCAVTIIPVTIADGKTC